MPGLGWIALIRPTTFVYLAGSPLQSPYQTYVGTAQIEEKDAKLGEAPFCFVIGAPDAVVVSSPTMSAATSDATWC
jgi:hypothetical protein